MDPQDYTQFLKDKFQHCVENDGCFDASFLIGGHAVALKFRQGPLIRQILPSLRPLAADGPAQEPEYRIHLWDGGDFPDLPVLKDMLPHENKVSLINSPPLHFLYNPEGRIFSMLDTQNRVGFYYVPDPAALPDYEVCTPMRMLVHRICQELGMYFVHSACVGYDGSAALLIGKSGSGKSTTALVSLMNGLDFLSDDYICISDIPGDIKAHSLYRGCKLMDGSLPELDALKRFIVPTNKTNSKNVLMLDGSAGRLRQKMGLKAVILPVIAHAPATAFKRIPAARALAELAGSTIMQMPGSADYMMKGLSALCATLPVFSMSLSEDPAEIAAALKLFLGGESYEKM